MNRYDFQDRVAVVTGGAQGIGQEIAARLAEGGARVEIWDMDPELTDKAARALGGTGRRVDVTDAAGVDAAAAKAVSERGAVDVLICSAGIAGLNAPTWKYPVEEWRRVMSVNADGVFHCCRAVVPHMIEQGYGRIVNIASIAGKEGNPNAGAYSASKAAVIALTKSLGKELAAYDIAVNCVTPAAARTRIFAQMSEEHIQYMLSKIPRGRFVNVDEVASLVAWLASSENSFSTGAVFDISGGRATY